MDTLSVVSANIAGDPKPVEIARAVDRRPADVLALIEVARRTLPWLRGLAGYRVPLVAGRDHILENRAVAILTRGIHKVRFWRELRLRTWWFFRRPKPPRRILVSRVEVRDRVWRIAAVHAPTRFPETAANDRARQEFFDACVEIAKQTDLPTVFVGDWNTEIDGLRALAKTMGGVVVEGTKVDHAIAVNCVPTQVFTLGRVDGWHGFLRYEFKAGGKS